jgi:hypothetical protein
MMAGAARSSLSEDLERKPSVVATGESSGDGKLFINLTMKVSVELRYGNFSQQNPAKKIHEKIEQPLV